MNSISPRVVVLLAIGGLLAGCVDPYGRPSYTGSGALIGGGSGALLGAAIDRRNPGAGALIGGAAGLVTGSLVGHAMDEDARRPRYYAVPPPPPVAPPVAPAPLPVPPNAGPSLFEIQQMCRSGIGDEVILNQIQATHAVYHLAAFEIIDLKTAGASERLINAMIATGANAAVTQEPPPPRVETVVVSPGPDYYWCGGEWVWNGAAWVWLPGRWVMPPYRGAVWVEARWVRGERGWHHSPGRWR